MDQTIATLERATRPDAAGAIKPSFSASIRQCGRRSAPGAGGRR